MPLHSRTKPLRRVQRRETMSTRLRRVQLARERQGPDGKWESNKKKAAAQLAKRKSLGLRQVFQGLEQKQMLMHTNIFKEASARAAELESVCDAATLLRIIADLERIPITAKLLQKTWLPPKLQGAMQRLPSTRAEGKRLLSCWRDKFREDMANLRERALSPSLAVAKRVKSELRSPCAQQPSKSVASRRSCPSPSSAEPASVPASMQLTTSPGRQQRITAFLKAPASA